MSARVILAMGKLYPQLTIEVVLDEGLVAIVAAGFDAGVRLGEMIAQDMVAVRLTRPFRAIMVAAPAYLKARRYQALDRRTRHPQLHRYRLVSSQCAYAWDLQDSGRELSVAVRGSVRVTDPLYARGLALQGVGIAYLFEPLVREDLHSGQLQQILPQASIEEPGLFLYFPRSASQTPKLRAFIDIARKVLHLR